MERKRIQGKQINIFLQIANSALYEEPLRGITFGKLAHEICRKPPQSKANSVGAF
jgi:hypothetical protein